MFILEYSVFVAGWIVPLTPCLQMKLMYLVRCNMSCHMSCHIYLVKCLVTYLVTCLVTYLVSCFVTCLVIYLTYLVANFFSHILLPILCDPDLMHIKLVWNQREQKRERKEAQQKISSGKSGCFAPPHRRRPHLKWNHQVGWFVKILSLICQVIEIQKS